MRIGEFLARNTTLVSLIYGVSSILGLIRESSIAYMFGTTQATDAFLVASTIPTSITGLISGTITVTFVTVFGTHIAQGDSEKAWRIANTMVSLFMVVLTITAIFLYFFSPYIVSILAPSYSGYQKELTVELTTIMIPNVVFGGLLGIFVGINNANQSYIAPASIGLISNIIILVSVFSLGQLVGIHGLAIGMLIGALLQLLLQIPSARKKGFNYQLQLNLADSGIKEIIILVIPLVVSAVAGQIYTVINRILASGLPSGSISSLYFADKLVFLPNLFTGAIGTVLFPVIVKYAAVKDWPRLIEAVIKAVRLLILVLFPAIVGIYVLKNSLISMLFEHGVFTAENTIKTAEIVPFYLGALFFGALLSVFVNVYYALKKPVFPVAIGLVTVVANIGFSILFIDSLQAKGLALANSLSVFVNLLLILIGMFLILHLPLKENIPYLELRNFIVKTFFSGIFMGIVVSFLYSFANSKMFLTTHFILGGCIISGIFVYILLIYLFKIEEVIVSYHWIKRKLGVD